MRSAKIFIRLKSQWFSHQQLDHSKTYKYHQGYSVSPVLSIKLNIYTPKTYMKKDCFHTPTHTSSPPKLATTHANTHRSTPRCPGLPQLVEWGHSLGKALSSLHLVVSVIYSECYVARDSWQEVRAGPQSRTRVLTWQKRPKDTSAVLFSFIDVFCVYSCTHRKLTHAHFVRHALYFEHRSVSLWTESMSFAAPLLNVSWRRGSWAH